jgi:hypothetical protein
VFSLSASSAWTAGGESVAYRLPSFNVDAAIWHQPNKPPAAPDLTVKGNLSPGKVTGIWTPANVGVANNQGLMWLRLPAGTDVRDEGAAAGADTVEVPKGSRRYYSPVWVDDIGLGFANEHRFAMLGRINPWPIPYPGGLGPNPPGASHPFQLMGEWRTGAGSPVTVFSPTSLSAPAPGHYWVLLLWFGNSAFPAVNGTSPVAGSLGTLSFGGVNCYSGLYYLPASTTSTALTVAAAGGVAIEIYSYVLFEQMTTGYISSLNTSSGNASTPTVSPPADPWSQPPSYSVGWITFMWPGGTQGANWGGFPLIAGYTFGGYTWKMSFGSNTLPGLGPYGSYTLTTDTLPWYGWTGAGLLAA